MTEQTTDTPSDPPTAEQWATLGRLLLRCARDRIGMTLFTTGMRVMHPETAAEMLRKLSQRLHVDHITKTLGGLHDAIATLAEDVGAPRPARAPGSEAAEMLVRAAALRREYDADTAVADPAYLRGTPVSVLRERADRRKPWDDCAGAVESVERNEGGNLIPGGHVRSTPRNP